MAFLDALSKAKSASEYQSDNFEVSTDNSRLILENLEPDFHQIYSEILQIKQQTSDLKIQIKRQKLNQHYSLGSEEVFESLNALEKQLDAVIKDKDSCLNILRNPESISENSLSLRRDRQADLIQSFDSLAKIIEAKQSHIANASWILNQNWNVYGQDLTSVNKKLLQVEASLARNLQQVNTIRKTIKS